MSKTMESKSVAQLLAEVDELVLKINSDAINDLKEEHRIAVEKHAQNLKKLKLEVQSKIEKKDASDFGYGAKGMHEAFQEITKAMGQLKRYIAGNRSDKVKLKTVT